jgi:hypothetical protein
LYCFDRCFEDLFLGITVTKNSNGLLFSPDGSGIVFWDDRNEQRKYGLQEGVKHSLHTSTNSV